MASFGGDDEDSQQGFSDNDNDQDENMDDADDADNDNNENTTMMEEDQDDQDDDEGENFDSYGNTPSRSRSAHGARDARSDGGREPQSATTDRRMRELRTPERRKSPLSHTSSPNALRSKPFQPFVRQDMISADLYDIVPTIAAPHSTSINAITATPDMRWVFSGGTDGWIRKFNWIDTVNAKSALTVAQRHPFVDSVVKAGVLMSYWENEEPSDEKDTGSTPKPPDESLPLSSVYSLAVHPEALWLLSGTEVGAINLQSVRHEEGKRITSLFKHSSAVSVMHLLKDNKTLLSGSWDKTILEWDLNTGQVKRSFNGSRGQIAAMEIRPVSSKPIPSDSLEPPMLTSSSAALGSGRDPDAIRDDATADGGDRPQDAPGSNRSPGGSLFEDHASLFGENEAPSNGAMLFDDEDEFSRMIAEGMKQQGGMDEEDTNTNGANGNADAPPLNPGDLGFASNQIDDLPTMLYDDSTEQRNEPLEPNGISTSFQDGMDTSNDNFLSGYPDQQQADDEENGFGRSAAGIGQNGVVSDDNSVQDENVFLDAAMDGTLRIWDRRQPNPLAKMSQPRNTPPWCMHACWSPNGNFIYAGRRNGTVDEYSIHKGLREPTRTLRFPGGSGAVSALRAMPNGQHLVCASFDILRLYDLQDEESARHSNVPFLIVPGHRTGVVSQLYLDPTCSYMISTGGNRGWEGATTEVLLGYEIGLAR